MTDVRKSNFPALAFIRLSDLLTGKSLPVEEDVDTTGCPVTGDLFASAGKLLHETAQVRMCGNSVCPPIAAAIVAANLRLVEDLGERAAD